MSTLKVESHPVAIDVCVTESNLSVDLADGRKISVPIVWFPRLQKASKYDREKWQLLGDGQGIHWPTLDEDICVLGLLNP